MDLSNVPQSLNAVTRDLQSENDRPSVVTLIQDLAFKLAQAEKYLSHTQQCLRRGANDGCQCELEDLQDDICIVLLRAQEARR